MIYATTRMNIKNILLSERSLNQKRRYCMILLIKSSQTGKTNLWWEKKKNSGCLGEGGSEDCCGGTCGHDGDVLYLDRDVGYLNVQNPPNSTNGTLEICAAYYV